MNKNERNSNREILSKKQKKREDKGKFVFFAVVILLALIIVIVIIYPSLKPPEVITTITPNSRLNANGLSIGDKNAPVVVQEFADFQCPYCAYFATTMEPGIESTYVDTGKVYFTYTPFSFIGAESTAAAEAAYCANDQGKFWGYHDILFANQGTENSGAFSDARLKAFAQSIGLDMNTFNSCYSSKKYGQTVQDDYNLAVQDKITSTPSFLVNGTLVTMADLTTTIDNALNAASTSTPVK